MRPVSRAEHVVTTVPCISGFIVFVSRGVGGLNNGALAPPPGRLLDELNGQMDKLRGSGDS